MSVCLNQLLFPDWEQSLIERCPSVPRDRAGGQGAREARGAGWRERGAWDVNHHGYVTFNFFNSCRLNNMRTRRGLSQSSRVRTPAKCDKWLCVWRNTQRWTGGVRGRETGRKLRKEEGGREREMGRRRVGERSKLERERGSGRSSVKTYLLQLQLHRENITTGYALYLVPSVGKIK